MNRPEAYPHELAYSQLASEYNLTPLEVEAASRVFGNDFESLETALSSMEEIDYDN